MAQRLVRTARAKARAWSAGRPARRVLLARRPRPGSSRLLAWALVAVGPVPAGARDRQRHAARARVRALSPSPASAARPAVAASPPASLTPGSHLAVAMIPVGGATKEHPAFFVIKGERGPEAGGDRRRDRDAGPQADAGDRRSGCPRLDRSASAARRPPGDRASSGPTAAAGATSRLRPPVTATAFPFKLPDKPGPHDSQALATNTTDGGIKYDVVYSLVTVQDGAPVDETNSAYALASCKACTTVAVSFQLVLIVGQSDDDHADQRRRGAERQLPVVHHDGDRDQIVVTLKSQPSEELCSG